MATMNELSRQTLFDDAILGAIMRVTGADELSARLMLAIHRGTVSGDIHIEGGQFRGTPLRASAASRQPAAMDVERPTWVWRQLTGSAAARSTTASLDFSAAYKRSLVVEGQFTPAA